MSLHARARQLPGSTRTCSRGPVRTKEKAGCFSQAGVPCAAFPCGLSSPEGGVLFPLTRTLPKSRQEPLWDLPCRHVLASGW